MLSEDFTLSTWHSGHFGLDDDDDDGGDDDDDDNDDNGDSTLSTWHSDHLDFYLYILFLYKNKNIFLFLQNCTDWPWIFGRRLGEEQREVPEGECC